MATHTTINEHADTSIEQPLHPVFFAFVMTTLHISPPVGLELPDKMTIQGVRTGQTSHNTSQPNSIKFISHSKQYTPIHNCQKLQKETIQFPSRENHTTQVI
ncbi:hypothetical protein [Geobacter pickeringii]|uniref:hypothetical protein n=1 Tax=Geobacter pickeringii TaxID=345632 RepID=UPI0006906158|nr:hypothetical protein [Geobacter pickeringii]